MSSVYLAISASWSVSLTRRNESGHIDTFTSTWRAGVRRSATERGLAVRERASPPRRAAAAERDELVDELQRLLVGAGLQRRHRRPGPGGLGCGERERRAGGGRAAVVGERELEAAVDALALHGAAASAADDRRGDRIEVLAALLVEAVVVGAQERADGGRDRRGTVAERLIREHGGELHHADAGLARGVPPACEADGLVRGSGHVPGPTPRAPRAQLPPLRHVVASGCWEHCYWPRRSPRRTRSSRARSSRSPTVIAMPPGCTAPRYAFWTRRPGRRRRCRCRRSAGCRRRSATDSSC